MLEVIPGILENDLAELKRKASLVAPFTEWIQLDISDGSLVPKATFHNIPELADIINLTGKSFEAQLMVASPEKYVKSLADAGFKRIIAHVECIDPRLFLEVVKYESVEAGLAIDATTELEVIEPFLDEIDSVLVMTVEAGSSGQKFLPETVEKIRLLHENNPDLSIEVDGGMNPQTAKLVKEAGVVRIVATSYIFNDISRISANISELSQV